MQRRFLEYFRASLGQVDHLVAIGYGLGDGDVNEILQDWLAEATPRRLEIVAPQIPSVPGWLQAFSSRITLTASSTTTFLEKLS